jgi:hypothetical protein
MKKVMLVFGTRPEAIKMCPLALELKKRPAFETIVCVTGQHREMLQQVLDVFNVTPDYDLEVMTESQTLFDITERVLRGMQRLLSEVRPATRPPPLPPGWPASISTFPSVTWKPGCGRTIFNPPGRRNSTARRWTSSAITSSPRQTTPGTIF